MRKVSFTLVSLASAVAMGLLWNIGQTGMSDTNAHLCEFAHHYFPDVSENCQATDAIVSAIGWVFLSSVIVLVIDVAWIIAGLWSERDLKSELSQPLDFFVDRHDGQDADLVGSPAQQANDHSEKVHQIMIVDLPKEYRPAVPDKIPAIDAFKQILESSKWASDLRQNPGRLSFKAYYDNTGTPEERMHERLVQQLKRDLHDKLAEGTIQAFGRLESDRPLMPIEKNEWVDIELLIDARALSGEMPVSCAQTRDNIRSRRIRYVDVQLSRPNLENIFQVSLEGRA